MKHYIRKMVCLSSLLFLACMMIPGISAETKAAETKDTTEVLAKIVIPEEEVFSTASNVAANGFVAEDGVRLRKNASSSSTILELMESDEYVHIFPNSSTTNWYYLERKKTGTRGYASRQYITPF